MNKTLYLVILEVRIRVRCPDPYSFVLLSRAYDAFITPSSAHDLNVDIVAADDAAYRILIDEEPPEIAADDYELIYLFEKGVTFQLQKRRKDLLFLHAGALEFQGRACILVAPSGSGKSTTTWALVNSGFHYLSDELAPIDPATLEVHPYPHALNLKKAPPDPFGLPADALHTEHTHHIPTDCFPTAVCERPVPLAAIFFLRYDPQATEPSILPVSKGVAGARIYSNALNLLAHSTYGLDAVADIARGGACFELITCDLSKTCAMIRQQMQ